MFSGAPDDDAGDAPATSVAAPRLMTDAASNPFLTKPGNLSSYLSGDGGPVCSSPGSPPIGQGSQVRDALKRLVRYAWKQGSRWSGGHLTVQLRHEMRREDRSVEQVCDDHNADDGQNG